MRKMDANEESEMSDHEESNREKDQSQSCGIISVLTRMGKTFVYIVNAQLKQVMEIPRTFFCIFEQDIRRSTNQQRKLKSSSKIERGNKATVAQIQVPWVLNNHSSEWESTTRSRNDGSKFQTLLLCI